MAQLVEQLLPTPEIRGSNPDIGNFIRSEWNITEVLEKK